MNRLTSLTRRAQSNIHGNPYDPPSPEHRRVWVPDTADGFLPGWIKFQSGDEGSPDATAEVVIATSGEMRIVPLYQLSPMNPPQFDGVEDIADLTHLNEASVINNLKMRYGAASIYVSRPYRYAECSLTGDSSDVFGVSYEPHESVSAATTTNHL
jgi:myosin protein heavy chain